MYIFYILYILYREYRKKKQKAIAKSNSSPDKMPGTGVKNMCVKWVKCRAAMSSTDIQCSVSVIKYHTRYAKLCRQNE